MTLFSTGAGMKSVPKFENGYQALGWLASYENIDVELRNLAKDVLDKMLYLQMNVFDKANKNGK